MIKRKVLFHSNYCGVATGFGGYIREIFEYLYKTGKYDLHLYATGVQWENLDYKRWPWKVYGALPNDQNELNRLNQDPGLMRLASYGTYNIDKVIKEVKPDILFCVEDFWGFSFCIDKPWWNKFPCVIQTTLDSIPLLPDAVEKCHQIKNFYVWADFAVQEFKKIAAEAQKQVLDQKKKFFARQWKSREDYQVEQARFQKFEQESHQRIDAFNNVKLLRGTVNSSAYFPLSLIERSDLRRKFNIDDDVFLVGSLSRNQLRKLWPNLIEGFKLFKDKNPEIKTKLALWTYWKEGWDIPRLMRQFKVDKEDVLAIYKCRETGEWFMLPYQEEDIDNPKTGHKKSMITVSISNFLPYEEVNKFYNILDCFCLPITSGGQERAALEAKLAGLVTLINPYSCFVDQCVDEAGSLSLDFSTYTEMGTQFIKANPYPSSICKQLKKAYDLDKEGRKQLGLKARKWVLDNFSIEVIGKKLEDIIDSFQSTNYDFNFDQKKELKEPNAAIPDIQDDCLFIKTLYELILKCPNMRDDDDGVRYWLSRLSAGIGRQQIIDYFRSVAIKDNNEIMTKDKPPEQIIEETGKKRFLMVCPESIGDIFYCSALFQSWRKNHPEWDLYFSCKKEYHELLEGNEYVFKVLEYKDEHQNELWATGYSNVKGLFDGYCFIPVLTQKFLSYITNNNIEL